MWTLQKGKHVPASINAFLESDLAKMGEKVTELEGETRANLKIWRILEA